MWQKSRLLCAMRNFLDLRFARADEALRVYFFALLLKRTIFKKMGDHVRMILKELSSQNG